MKIKTFSLLALAVFLTLIAITSSASEMPASNNSMTAIYNISPMIQMGQYNSTEQANIMLVEQGYSDFSKGDIPSLLDNFTIDAVWVQPGPKLAIGGIYHGKPEIAGFFKNLSANIEFTQFNITNYMAKGNTVVVIGSYQAIVKPTGRTYNSDFVSIFTVDNRKIAKYETYHDTAAIVSAHMPQNISDMNKTTPESLTEEENVQEVQQEYASFSKGDLPSVLNAMAENVEWLDPGAPYVPYGGDYQGLNQVKEYFIKLNESMEFTQLNASEFIPDGNKVIVLGSYSARAKTTGQSYKTDFVQIWTLQNGKIVRVQSIEDTAAAAAAFTQSHPSQLQGMETSASVNYAQRAEQYLTGYTNSSNKLYQITVPDFINKSKANNWTIVDIRLPNEYKMGHIKGAVNIPINHLMGNMSQISPDKSVAVYCHFDTIAASGVMTLRVFGGRNDAWILLGGAKAWQAAGMPVINGTSPT